tara:strand:+ start:4473 stop:4805 length:333 start_codon:yes stop_codon:yes gene_type:complete
VKQLLVISTVIISVFSSLLLNFASNFQNKTTFIVFLFLSLVMTFNIFKFFLWGYIHKSYSISNSYPLTSIFFPIIFIISIVTDEVNFSLYKLFGVLFIISGIIIFEFKKI